MGTATSSTTSRSTRSTRQGLRDRRVRAGQTAEVRNQERKVTFEVSRGGTGGQVPGVAVDGGHPSTSGLGRACVWDQFGHEAQPACARMAGAAERVVTLAHWERAR